MDKPTLYNKFISLLQDVKLCEGPVAVSNTLRRHPKVRSFIKEYQARIIKGYENWIDEL